MSPSWRQMLIGTFIITLICSSFAVILVATKDNMTPNTWQCEPVWQYNGLGVDMTQTHTRMSIMVYVYDLERLLPIIDWLRANFGNPAKQFADDAEWVNVVRKTSTSVLKWAANGKLRKVSSELDTYEVHLTMNADIFAMFKLTWGLTPIFA